MNNVIQKTTYWYSLEKAVCYWRSSTVLKTSKPMKNVVNFFSSLLPKTIHDQNQWEVTSSLVIWPFTVHLKKSWYFRGYLGNWLLIRSCLHSIKHICSLFKCSVNINISHDTFLSMNSEGLKTENKDKCLPWIRLRKIMRSNLAVLSNARGPEWAIAHT